MGPLQQLCAPLDGALLRAWARASPEASSCTYADGSTDLSTVLEPLLLHLELPGNMALRTRFSESCAVNGTRFYARSCRNMQWQVSVLPCSWASLLLCCRHAPRGRDGLICLLPRRGLHRCPRPWLLVHLRSRFSQHSDALSVRKDGPLVSILSLHWLLRPVLRRKLLRATCPTRRTAITCSMLLISALA